MFEWNDQAPMQSQGPRGFGQWVAGAALLYDGAPVMRDGTPVLLARRGSTAEDATAALEDAKPIAMAELRAAGIVEDEA